MGRAFVSLKNIDVIYNQGEGSKEVYALKNITLDIFPHEYIIFFGPSGCGKSTLLNVIAGLETIAKGKVMVGGKELSALNDEDLATYHRHQIGFIFQAYNLVPSLSVLENIALPQMFEGSSVLQWQKKAGALADRFEIFEQIHKLPSQLSGGQQQRVGIARALINNPAIILADEPTGNLDSKNTAHVFDILRKLNVREKKTILLVTHAPDFLGEADRIFYMKDGKIIDEIKNKNKTSFKQAGEEDIQKTFPWKRLLKDKYVPTSIKSKKLSEFILKVPEERKIARMEALIEKRLQSIIGPMEFVTKLDTSYYRGGAGLDKRVAERMSIMVEHVMVNAHIINQIQDMSEDKVSPVVREIAKNILEAVKITLAESRKTAFEILVKSRLQNKISPWEVKKILDISVNKGGFGLRKQTAEKTVHYLELVILIASQSTSLATV